MNVIIEFLKHIPDAAASPLAFVAYCLVLAAWLTRSWLYISPQRDARRILATFRDDHERLEALGRIFNETPPAGLQGNEAILTWVKAKSSDKSKVLLVVAWLATIIALLIFLVAVSRASANSWRQVSIKLHRAGTGDCPNISASARLVVSLGDAELGTIGLVQGCEASLAVPKSRIGLATVKLVDAQPYELASPNATYQLTLNEWVLYVTDSRLRISLFDYSGDCTDLTSAFKTFTEILRSKAGTLRAMFDLTDHRFDYLSSVSVIATGRPLDMSPQEVELYWQQTSSLQVLSGLCYRKGSEDFMKSQVFSGSLSGTLPEPFVAELPVTADEFGATRDIHTVSILYALSQEAYRQGLGQDLVIKYLSRARETAGQISGGTGRDLVGTIDRALQQAGAPSRMSL